MRSIDNFTKTGRLKIDWSAQNIPVHWFNDDIVLTYLADIYIITTAEIERFTVQVARSLKDKIQDVQLKQAWEQFIKEEIAHAFQHTCVNAVIRNHKYPVNFITRNSKLLFWIASRTLGIKSKLAFILAMEFWAHEMASASLERNLFPKNKLAIYDFLRWHSEEELSHADLCLKVYRYFGGGYIRRTLFLFLFSIYTFISVNISILLFSVIDLIKKRPIRCKQRAKATWFLLGYDGIMWSRFRTYIAFYKFNFKSCEIKTERNKHKGSSKYVQ